MSYSDQEVFAATAAMEKYRGGADGEIGAALAVVVLSAARTAREARVRNDLIRVTVQIVTFSRPDDLPTRLAAPVARRIQSTANDRYLQGIETYVKAGA